ncbi:hypothetical protein ABT173_37005 [Streptomyces sp. NPDC001795]
MTAHSSARLCRASSAARFKADMLPVAVLKDGLDCGVAWCHDET